MSHHAAHTLCMTKRAALYCRISRDRVGAGLGVDRQEQDNRELAAKIGATVTTVYRDNDLSAYSGKPRPGYLRLLEDLHAGRIDIVLAWHTDRLHRSPAELEEYITACEPRGVPTHTVKAGPLDLTTPSGRMAARIHGAVARYEVEHSIERQQRAKLQAATDGRWKGGRRPYGYGDDGATVVPVEADEVMAWSRAVLAGASLRSIAADLNARGVPTSTGGPWRQDTVRKVLLRPRNAGLMEHQGRVIGKAVWPAIVPEDTWRAVVSVVTNPDRRTHTGTVRRWMGGGLYLCGVCGARIKSFASSSTRRNRGRPQYVCSVSKHVARTIEEVDQFVADLVVGRLSRPDARSLIEVDASVDMAALDAKLLTIRTRLNELASLYAADALDAQQLREGSELLRRQRAAIEVEQGEASRGSVLAEMVESDDPAGVWARLDLDRRRAVVDTLMVVTLLPAPRGRPRGWRAGAGRSYFDSRSVGVAWRQPADA